MVEITFINSLSFIAPFPSKTIAKHFFKMSNHRYQNSSFKSMIQIQNRSMKAAKSFLLFELVRPKFSF